jgi:phospholipid/cholesterol/gamma-HCH transport system ATP-binding protein
MDAIRLEGIFKSFSGKRKQVLKNLNLTFPRGKLTYILGASGSGKSVLLKHILGLLRPDEGEVWIEDIALSQMNSQQLCEMRLRFGVLFQNSALFDSMTVLENIVFPLREHTQLEEEEILQKAKKTLKILGLQEGWNQYPNELSGGMKKRVGLARAIIREPSILLYDEPTSGLDTLTRATVDSLIETLKRELQLTSIVISHDICSALFLADCIAFLSGGCVVFFGDPEAFRVHPHPEIQKFLEAERHAASVFRRDFL